MVFLSSSLLQMYLGSEISAKGVSSHLVRGTKDKKVGIVLAVRGEDKRASS